MGCQFSKNPKTKEGRAAQRARVAGLGKGPRVLEHDYIVSSMIGRGHYGWVYKGVSRKDGRTVAVKMIDRAKSRAERLQLEVKILHRIHRHPNIVSMHDVYYTPQHVNLVLEFMSGGELFERLVNKGPMKERQAASVCRKLASALKYIHKRGVVHRDLKPENILLVDKTDDSDVKLADFGLSRLRKTPDEMMTTVCGTWAYSAPEVRIDRKGYHHKVDLWSLGVILYVILSGYHPFDPEGVSPEDELQNAIKKGAFDFDDPVWEGISESAKDLVKKLIVVNPADRIDSHDVLVHPWVKRHAPRLHRREHAISRSSADPENTPNTPSRMKYSDDDSVDSDDDAIAGITQRAASVTRQRSGHRKRRAVSINAEEIRSPSSTLAMEEGMMPGMPVASKKRKSKAKRRERLARQRRPYSTSPPLAPPVLGEGAGEGDETKLDLGGQTAEDVMNTEPPGVGTPRDGDGDEASEAGSSQQQQSKKKQKRKKKRRAPKAKPGANIMEMDSGEVLEGGDFTIVQTARAESPRSRRRRKQLEKEGGAAAVVGGRKDVQVNRRVAATVANLMTKKRAADLFAAGAAAAGGGGGRLRGGLRRGDASAMTAAGHNAQPMSAVMAMKSDEVMEDANDSSVEETMHGVIMPGEGVLPPPQFRSQHQQGGAVEDMAEGEVISAELDPDSGSEYSRRSHRLSGAMAAMDSGEEMMGVAASDSDSYDSREEGQRDTGFGYMDAMDSGEEIAEAMTDSSDDEQHDRQPRSAVMNRWKSGEEFAEALSAEEGAEDLAYAGYGEGRGNAEDARMLAAMDSDEIITEAMEVTGDLNALPHAYSRANMGSMYKGRGDDAKHRRRLQEMKSDEVVQTGLRRK